jgi:hypothetical protein
VQEVIAEFRKALVACPVVTPRDTPTKPAMYREDVSKAFDAFKADLLAHLASQEQRIRQLDEGYGYLSRLFTSRAPQCEPLDDLPGLATQIDNYIVGLKQRIRELQDELETERIVSASRLGSRSIDVAVIDRMTERIRELEQWVARLKTDGHMVWSLMLRGDIVRPVALVEAEAVADAQRSPVSADPSVGDPPQEQEKEDTRVDGSRSANSLAGSTAATD